MSGPDDEDIDQTTRETYAAHGLDEAAQAADNARDRYDPREKLPWGPAPLQADERADIKRFGW